MVTLQQKTFCVRQFWRLQSVVSVQRAFQTTYGTKPPTAQSIRRWCRQFEAAGSLSKGKSPGRPRIPVEQVERIRETFETSPVKSTRRASRELAIPQTTVWRVLKKRLNMKPYKYHMLQALRPTDEVARLNFCHHLTEELDENVTNKLVFSDEACFHLSGKVNRHNLRIWGTEKPHETIQHERDSPKVNVFCAISKKSVYGPFFFAENTVQGPAYLDMLEAWLFPQLKEAMNGFIFQQDGAPPHWHRDVRNFLNTVLPHRWIGRSGPQDLALHAWPPRSPDLTPCDFFLWGCIKDIVYVPPLPTEVEELRNRIVLAVQSISVATLERVWQELTYRLDIVQVTKGRHFEHL